MDKKFSIEQDKIYVGWFKKLQSKGKLYNELLAILIRASGMYFGIYEEWWDANGYEGLYQASNFGRVKSLKRTILHMPGRYRNIKEKTL